MLQRLVRSIVSTAPRPCLIEDVPWLWSVSVTASKSRPGNRFSSRSRNCGLIASVSVNVPCIGQVFSIRTLPSRSMMWASISATCSLTSDSIDCSPERIRARASRTQVGQSESVVRGHPNCGFERCRCFSSGAGAHFGWKVPPSKCLLIACNAGHAARAPYVSASSTGLHTFIRVKPPRSAIPTAWPTVEIPDRPEVNGRCRMAAQRHFHIGDVPFAIRRCPFSRPEGRSLRRKERARAL